MSKITPLHRILSGFLSAAKSNNNVDIIEDAFENTLSRDGSSPNAMLADIDLNSNKIINSAEPTANTDVATKLYVDTSLENFSGGVAATGPQGPTGATGPAGATGATGATGTAGTNGNKGWSPILSVVTDSARRVLQVSDWTGGEGTKPATGSYIGASGLTAVLASAVDIRGAQGTSGAGTGDLLAANNLSDLASSTTARTNLGLGSAALQAASSFLQVSNNLSDITPSTARTNLGLGTAAVLPTATWLQTANNLSDISSVSTARTNLGLGTAALVATTSLLQVGNNLSDLSSASTARTNLGLGTAATSASTSFAAASHTHTTAADIGTGVAASLAAGSNISLSTVSGVTTISSSGGGGGGGGSGGTASTWVGTSTLAYNGSGNTVTLNKPGSLTTGDTVFVLCDGGGSTPTITGGSGGWTSSATVYSNIAVLSKVVTGTDVAATLTLNGSFNVSAIMVAYRSASTIASKIASQTQTGSTGSTAQVATAIGFTPTSANGRLLFFGISLGSFDPTWPMAFQPRGQGNFSTASGSHFTIADINANAYSGYPISSSNASTSGSAIAFSVLELY